HYRRGPRWPPPGHPQEGIAPAKPAPEVCRQSREEGPGRRRQSLRSNREEGSAVSFTLVMLPPQTGVARAWAARVPAEVPGVRVLAPETIEEAARQIVYAEAAFGTIPPDVLKGAGKLRWLQAPAAAPPAGYYYPALIAHPVVVTNFREIYNDHIGAHIMAFVLAFARRLHYYVPRQLRRD